MTAPSPASGRPIRVVIQQPALPKYRVPVFAELAKRPGIDLKVVYGEMDGLPNVEPSGFVGELIPIKFRKLLGRPAMWHDAQWRYASRATTDVLILSWNLHFTSLVPALLRARASGVKTILWGHGYSREESGVRSFLRSRVGKLGDALLFYGQRTADAFIRSGWPRERIYVARNSLDQTAIAAARDDWLGRPNELDLFRTRTGIGTGPVLLFVSRLLPENRIDLLIEAAAKLRASYPTLKVVLIGGGDPTALRQLAQSLGIAETVVFAGAIYDETNIAPYFLTADLFVYPAKLGLSIMHCFGYGVPIVTSASEDAQFPEREALVEGENGLTFADGDPVDLAASIHRILSQPALRKSMSTAAIRTIRERYSIERMVDGFEAGIRFVTRRSSS
jgi:glycosyltransferase involved in cell wall biosynthesis